MERKISDSEKSLDKKIRELKIKERKIDREHYVVQCSISLSFLCLLVFDYFMGLTFALFFIGLCLVLVYVIGEYHHRVIMYPLIKQVAYLEGQINAFSKTHEILSKIKRKCLT